MDLVLHVAMEADYRGRRVAPGAVAYIACEGERGLSNRVAAWQAHNPDAPEDLPFWLLTTRLDLAAEHEALAEDIAAQATAPAVIVIDTLNRSLNDSESKDEDMSAYIKGADYLREKFNCAVVIIHHCGIESTRPRGHTSLAGAADAQIAITNANGTVGAEVQFMKDGEARTAIGSTLKVIELGEDEDGEPITSCAIEPTELTPKAATKGGLAGQAKKALGFLTDLIALEGEPLPQTPGFPSDLTVRGVTKSRWRDYCRSRSLVEADEPETVRKAFQRAFDKLTAMNLVGVLDGVVWMSGTMGQTGHV